MHLPVNKSLSGALVDFAVGFCVICRACVGDTASSSADSNPFVTSALRFFFPNNEGNGWLLDRPWPGRVGLEELEFKGASEE
jgi:hypothetical protein